jgi:hypothetical protein
VRLPTKRRRKIIGGDLAQGSIRGMNGYGMVLVAQSGHSTKRKSANTEESAPPADKSFDQGRAELGQRHFLGMAG